MEDYSGSRDQSRDFEILTRVGIERLTDAELLRVYLAATLLAGPHGANEFLVEAMRSFIGAGRDPSNPHDDLERRLIEIIQTMPIPSFLNTPGGVDLEDIQQLLKQDDDYLLLELFEALGAGFRGADFLEMRPDVPHDAFVRLRRSVLSRVVPASKGFAVSAARPSSHIAPRNTHVRDPLVTPGLIAAILGGELTLGHRIATEAGLHKAVEEGLPAAALDFAIDRVGYVPRRLRTAYKRLTGPLPMELSEKAARLARVIAMAEYVFDNDATARSFLTTPRRLLSSVQTPLDAAMDEAGARRVEEILANIFHGIPV